MKTPETLLIKGMHCGACVERVKTILLQSGSTSSSVSLSHESALCSFPSSSEREVALRALHQAGFTVTNEKISSWLTLERRLILSAIGAVPLLLHMVLSYSLFHNPWFQLLCATPSLIFGLPYYLSGAWGAIRSRTPNMDLLVTIAAFSGVISSLWGIIADDHEKIFFEPVSSIITIVLLGSFLERHAFGRAERALESLKQSTPATASKVQIGIGKKVLVTVPTDELSINDEVVVRLGEAVPCDGVIVEGLAEVDEAILTGESIPVTRSVGAEVYGGSIVRVGGFTLKVTKQTHETFQNQLVSLVQKARESRPRFQQSLDKVVAVFVPMVLFIAFGIVFFGPWLLEISSSEALSRALAVLVIACPCAIGVATPVALSVGLSTSAKNGILFRDLDSIVGLSKLTKLYFDKTGTITDSKMLVSDWTMHREINQWREKIASLEIRSQHPIAQALLDFCGAVDTLEVQSFIETAGIGVKGKFLDGDEMEISNAQPATDALLRHSVFVTVNGELIISFAMSEVTHADTASAVAFLNKQNISLGILSGDTMEKVKRVAHELKISDFKGGLSPLEKLKVFTSTQDQGSVLGFVGDGVNDAPILAAASVGIAMADASALAKTSAHVLLLRPGLLPVTKAILISKKITRIIRQNLFWAFAYNLIAIPLAIAGIASPTIGALTMVFSDLCVVGNAQRLRRI